MAMLDRPAGSRLLGIGLPTVQGRTLLAGLTLLVLGFIALSLPSYPILTRFRAESLQALPNVLAPLVILAFFIERGVEVVLAGWRNDGSMAREAELRQALEAESADRQWEAKAKLDQYTAESQRLAFFIAFAMSLLISMMGVRAIEMLIDGNVVASASPAQRNLFVRVDILVTALLLTGGAEGIHRVVTAFTTFVDQTRASLDQPRVRTSGAGSAPLASPAAGGRNAPEVEG